MIRNNNQINEIISMMIDADSTSDCMFTLYTGTFKAFGKVNLWSERIVTSTNKKVSRGETTRLTNDFLSTPLETLFTILKSSPAKYLDKKIIHASLYSIKYSAAIYLTIMI